MSEGFIVAVPSNEPGGLEAELADHFGHCAAFTLVNIKDGKIGKVAVLKNIPHEQGVCMAPVNYLAGNNVKVMLAGGMGMRPLMGFSSVGIEVFHNNGLARVNDAITAFIEGRLPRFSQNNTCSGGGTNGNEGSCGNN